MFCAVFNDLISPSNVFYLI